MNTKQEITEQSENKTPIAKAVESTGMTNVILTAAKNRHNLESFAGLLGVAIPERIARKAKADKRYKYSSVELGDMGMALEDAASIGTAALHRIDDPTNPELLAMTLLQYFKRTSTSIKRTAVGEEVVFQVVKRPEMTVTDSQTFPATDWEAQANYLATKALEIAISIGFIADADGNNYLLAIGKKKPIIVRMQELAKAE